MKKTVCLLLAALLAACVLAFSGCKPEQPPEPAPKRKELLFLIDEGIGGKELVYALGGDYAKLDAALNNIDAALAPLREAYDVSVLMYPTWNYSAEGYGANPEIAINRISPAMLHTLDVLAQKDIPVYLEMYSSGINTSQNGELGNLPYVKLRWKEEKIVKSIPMDLDCLEALMDEYEIIRGIRFHELIGSHAHTDVNHGFKVDTEAVYAMADVCAGRGRRLVWGDHMWDRVFTDPAFYWWEPVLNEVCDRLGEKLTVNFNNNSWSVMTSLQYKQTMENYRNGSRWGYSVQSWFWQELDARALQPDPSSGTRWYQDAMFDMPVELMAAFTLETFRRGGSLVQFEPAFYFFDWPYPGARAEQNDNAGTVEDKGDYAARLAMKRFTELLLNAEAHPEDYPSMVPSDYYTENETALVENLWAKKPKKYVQATLVALGTESVQYWDTYSSNPQMWYRSDENRYREWVMDGSATDVYRLDVSFNQIDELLVIGEDAGKRTARVYSHLSAYLANIDNVAQDNADGVFCGLAALNLVRENSFRGDPDEIVTARSKDGKINLTAYRLQARGADVPSRQNFQYVEDAALTAEIRAGAGEIPAREFLAVLGFRSVNGLYVDNTKQTDDLLVASMNESTVTVRGSIAGTAIENSFSLPGEAQDVTLLDADLDHRDELAFLVGSDVVFLYYEPTEKEFLYASEYNLTLSGSPSKIVGRRWTNYYNLL